MLYEDEMKVSRGCHVATQLAKTVFNCMGPRGSDQSREAEAVATARASAAAAPGTS